MTPLEELKLIIREKDCPFFEDSELEYYLGKYGTVEKTAYYCLIMKAEDTTLSVSGLSCGDTSSYFRRLAQRYRPNNSGILRGV
jgi:hypothetical protein